MAACIIADVLSQCDLFGILPCGSQDRAVAGYVGLELLIHIDMIRSYSSPKLERFRSLINCQLIHVLQSNDTICILFTSHPSSTKAHLV